jgi:hypothetical protein
VCVCVQASAKGAGWADNGEMPRLGQVMEGVVVAVRNVHEGLVVNKGRAGSAREVQMEVPQA